MRFTSGFIGVCLGAVLGLGGCAQMQPEGAGQATRVAQVAASAARSAPEREFVITPEIMRAALQFAIAKKAAYTDPVDCNPVVNVCERVKIRIVQPQDANGVYCVGLIPESIKFGPSDNVAKTIVWEIVPPPPGTSNPPNSKYEFYEDSKVTGIVLLNDSNPAQLKNGKLGNGNTGNKDPLYYNMRNDHKKKLDASYLPIIVQRVPASTTDPEKVALCGTPDPRILND